MHTLPSAILHVLQPFTWLFSTRVWPWAQILIVGAILAPGTHTVTATLRVMGLHTDAQVPELPSRAQPGGLVATGGQPHPAGDRNAALVVGSGDPAYDAQLVGAVLGSDAVRASVAPGPGDAGTPSSLVYQGAADIQRYPGVRPPAPVAGHVFWDVANKDRHDQNPQVVVHPAHGGAGLRRTNTING